MINPILKQAKASHARLQGSLQATELGVAQAPRSNWTISRQRVDAVRFFDLLRLCLAYGLTETDKLEVIGLGRAVAWKRLCSSWYLVFPELRDRQLFGHSQMVLISAS